MPVMTEFICPKQYCSNIRIVLKLDTIAHSCRRLGCSCFVPTCCRLDFQLKKIARLSSQATFCTVCLGLPSSLLQSRDSSQLGLWKFSVETAQHVSKVITWKRSVSSLSSSSRSPFTTSMIKDDAGDSSSDFVEQFSMVSGSHSSTLDRLYAWERKLHDEIKQKTNWKILPPIHQRGRTVEIFNSFELVLDPVSGTLDRAFLEKKQELYKKVFPKFYVLGWYSTGSDVQETDMLIHKALMDINESPVYLLLNPAINLSQKDLPVTIYESGFQVMGVGFTGSLASSRPKHGDHRFYMQHEHRIA